MSPEAFQEYTSYLFVVLRLLEALGNFNFVTARPQERAQAEIDFVFVGHRPRRVASKRRLAVKVFATSPPQHPAESWAVKINKHTYSLALYSESSTTSGLPLLLFVLRPSSVKDLEEVGSPPPHPRVDVGFACLDMIVEVISESLNVRNVGFPSLWC